MNTERYGEIQNIENDNDLSVAKCSLAVLDDILGEHFLFNNIIITATPSDCTVAVTLDIPSEFYRDYVLDGKDEKFNYGHLRKLCDIAKTSLERGSAR